MRELIDHKINRVNDSLKIQVMDEPGSGGACHRYEITGFDTEKNPSAVLPDGYAASFSRLIVMFQNGPLQEAEPNGVTHEALLTILIDRLKGFQSGPFSTKENSVALTHLETALLWLQKRTRDRLARGVEGTTQK